MDYEIFMLSRVQEHYERSGDPRGAVADGLAATARIITAAAAIMVAVATGFALDPSVMVKIIGVGMASAILVDVTIGRLLLVPAAMALLGARNWYLPRALDRILPRRTPAPQPGRGLIGIESTAAANLMAATRRIQVTPVANAALDVSMTGPAALAAALSSRD
jgi:RND superfamily putative drug exporter